MMHAFGYVASVVLVLTLVAQIREQWRRKSVEGVSPLLFVGQIAASAGFVVHSAVIGSTLFVVTNAAAGLTGVAGLALYLALRRRTRADGDARDRPRSSAPPGVTGRMATP